MRRIAYLFDLVLCVGVIIAYLRQVLKVFVIGFRRYPTLAAVHIDTSFSLICAALYNLLDFAMTIIQSSLCRNDFYPTDKSYNGTVSDVRPSRYLKYYGTGANLVFFQLLTDIPRYLFLSYISVKLVSLLVKRLQHRPSIRKNLSREQKNLLYASLPDSIESRYVRKLLNPKINTMPMNRLASKFRFIYTWRDDFRFSSRVICVYAAIYLLLFFITVQVRLRLRDEKNCSILVQYDQALVRVPPSLPSLRKQLQIVVNVIVTIISPPDTNLQEEEDDQSSDFRLPTFYLPYVLAIIFTLVVTIIQLSAMLASIRRNLLQAFRGDHTEIPPPKSSRNVNYVTGNFRFAGTLIGYVILAYVFLGLLSFIVAIIIGAAVTNGGSKFIEDILKTIIPAMLFIFFKMYLNKILGKYVFLQHELNVLSLNNRRVFMIFLYFNIFLDAFLGLFAAIIRLLKSTIGGILYMCRLDYSPLGRKLETKDAGFSAYCGFIHVECAHRHPVLLCFMSHLLRTQLYGRANQRWSKARHRWALAVLLLNNPTLIYERKRFLSRSEEHSMKLALIGRKNMRERKNGGVQIELTEISPEERF